MTVEFKPAVRSNVPLLIGIAGPTGSGKTYSAYRLAAGIAQDKPFLVIDTEAGRGLHYADKFDYLHTSLDPPYTPARYLEALEAALTLDPPVIVIDSASHEHSGDGGVLDMHEAELQRMAGDDWKRRESMKFAAWVKPKAEHKRLMDRVRQTRTHLILALRAEEKIELTKDPKTGKLEVQPKRTLAGHVGWIPICGKDLPYELTLSLVVTPDRPGVPHPIKLQEDHQPMVPLDEPLSEETGGRLAVWALGEDTVTDPERPGPVGAAIDGEQAAVSSPSVSELQADLLELAVRLDAVDATRDAIAAHPDDVEWLHRQITNARASLEAGPGPNAEPSPSAPKPEPASSDDQQQLVGVPHEDLG